MTPRRVAIITPDAVDPQMAGPAIRAWNMADVLAADHDVHLCSTSSARRQTSSFDVRAVDGESIAEETAWADVVVLHPAILRTHAGVDDGRTPIVVDVYDPFHLENLEPDGQTIGARAANVAHLNSVLNDALLRGDYFLCASDRQRDFWIGSLAALGRINPATYDDDPTLDTLIGVVPFGIPVSPPEKRRAVLRGEIPGIGVDDRVLLWGGGVYNWFDPVTLIHAVALARHRLPEIRLVFLGMRHPNRDLPPMRTAVEARRRAEELGLVGHHVFFNEGWIPYDERADYLLEADVGVSTHLHHVETAFSFRTRMLDYLWAGLPILTSNGDVFADLAASEDIGAAVAPGDPRALADAMVDLLSDEKRLADRGHNASRVAERFRWPAALRPLAAFAADPRPAADRRGRVDSTPARPDPIPPPGRRRWRRR